MPLGGLGQRTWRTSADPRQRSPAKSRHPKLATPTLAPPTLATPTLATPTLATPALATPTLAGPPGNRTKRHPPFDRFRPPPARIQGHTRKRIQLIDPR